MCEYRIQPARARSQQSNEQHSVPARKSLSPSLFPWAARHMIQLLFPCSVATCSPEYVQLLVLDKTPLFFSMRDGPWFPTLRLLHQVGAGQAHSAAAAAAAAAAATCPPMFRSSLLLMARPAPLYCCLRCHLPPACLPPCPALPCSTQA